MDLITDAEWGRICSTLGRTRSRYSLLLRNGGSTVDLVQLKTPARHRIELTNEAISQLLQKSTR